MLRGSEKRLHIGERLPSVFGGRDVLWLPNRKPPRLSGPTVPPVPGYVAWYDANDVSTITLDASGLVVTAWSDKSSSGFNATASGSPMLFKPSRLRNTVIWFGATGTSLASSCPASDRTSSAFVAGMVPLLSAFDGTLAMLGSSGDGGNEFRVGASSGDGKLGTLVADVVFIGSQGNAAVTAGTPFVAAQVLTATDVTHYLGTTSETDSNSTSFTASRTLVIGRSPTVFESGRHQFYGWIGEIVIYDTTLSSGDTLATIDYLRTKWSIA